MDNLLSACYWLKLQFIVNMLVHIVIGRMKSQTYLMGIIDCYKLALLIQVE